MVWGLRLFSSWHSSTPSLRVCAKSNTCAVSAVTRWFTGSTLQLISHMAHCLQFSITSGGIENSSLMPNVKTLSLFKTRAGHDRSCTQLRPFISLQTPASPLEDRESCSSLCALHSWDWQHREPSPLALCELPLLSSVRFPLRWSLLSLSLSLYY